MYVNTTSTRTTTRERVALATSTSGKDQSNEMLVGKMELYTASEENSRKVIKLWRGEMDCEKFARTNNQVLGAQLGVKTNQCDV
jgi:hypothetical protein